MYLRSITLKGFKSFPDRMRLQFGPGVSVVVGPNGSGKSNITDAVLWALGEQSPVAVRGQSMQDVIFAGAPGRKASSAAEVELVLDDSEGVLGLGVPEVSIVRRLHRTGEGEYRLAGARCRLVDVIEALSDTGLGKEMHSVISQGRVESLVTSKPRDRRLLIEEAAGLGKHRKRRRRAQLKLVRTQENLDRALDVEREARSRLRPLKRQAEAAELHARLERQTLEARWELTRDELRVREAELAQRMSVAEEARTRREALERELSAVAAKRQSAEEALARRASEREELSRRAFAVKAAADGVGFRTDTARSTMTELGARLDRNRARYEHLRAQAPPSPDGHAQARLAELEAELTELERRREQALSDELAQLERERGRAAALVDEHQAALEDRARTRAQVETSLEHSRVTVADAERRVEAARLHAARVGGELAAANHLLAIQARSSGAAALVDELEVEPGYELALAAALDGRLRAAVVEDRGAAERLLDRAGADGGRALIRAARRPARHASGEAPPASGAECLADRVSGPEPVLAMVGELLGRVWVVDSLNALADDFDGVAVTRAGRVFSASAGELRQAPAGGEERVLAERNRRAHLIRATEEAAAAELAAKAALEAALEERRRREEETERAVEAQRTAVRARDEALDEERRLGETIQRRRREPREGELEMRRLAIVAQLDRERQSLERAEIELAEHRMRLDRLARAVGADEQLLPAIQAVLRALAQLHEAIAAQQAAFDRALENDRAADEHLAARLRGCAQDEAALQTRLHTAGEACTDAEVDLQRARDRAAGCGQELEELARTLELEAIPAEVQLGAQEREALVARLERLARRREQLGPVNPLAQQEHAEALEHVEELERQRVDLETALKELERLIADTDRQIKQSFEQTFQAAAANFEQVAAQLFPGGSGRLRLVVEPEGPAPVLGGVTSSPDGADADETVVEGEESELAGLPGEEEELLGVEIEINPAGKAMKRLSLLSGGEKSMTALAFLFAVFLARPCPFYILDEVEAALDDINIDRFLGLLRSYSQRAQFIVVTHQKRTMEAADFLYGVSMGGDGISKVISRRLPQEADAPADAEAAGREGAEAPHQADAEVLA